MRFFFRSRQFKMILTVLIGLIAAAVVCIVIGGKLSPQADIFGTVTAPFRAAFTYISETVKDVSEALSGENETELKNAELETEINDLRDKLADYEKQFSYSKYYLERQFREDMQEMYRMYEIGEEEEYDFS